MEEIKFVKLPREKRIFDIIISLILFLISSPLLCALLLWIIIEQLFVPASRGSLFYSEIRVSGKKEFRFFKFRIFKQAVLVGEMKKGGCLHTKPLEGDDNNLTYYGRFLKQVYMDEFPQLYNVLKGEMTLVGPRPTNVENSKNMREMGDYTRERMVGGITGTIQAHKGEGLDQGGADDEYIDFIESNSGLKIFLYDIKILWKTVWKVFKAEGI